MIDQHTIGLIHAGLDGELDEAGHAELDRALSQSDEAREYQASMQELASFMDRAPAPEMPENLHEKIVSSIQLPSKKSRNWLAAFGDFPGFVRYGLATAAGLLMAVGIYEYRPGMDGSADLSRMTGTLLPTKAVVDEVTLDRAQFELESLSSEVSLLRRGESLVLDIRMNADNPVSIDLQFLGERLRFDAIARMESELDSIEIADGGIHVEAVGPQHFAVVLSQEMAGQGEARVLMNWSQAAKVLKTQEFTIN